MDEEKKRVRLELEEEETIVMGLKSLMAIGDCIACISLCQDHYSLDDQTLTNLGHLVIEKSESVFEALQKEKII